MSVECKYVFSRLVPENRAVAIRVILPTEKPEKTCAVSHHLQNGNGLKNGCRYGESMT